LGWNEYYYSDHLSAIPHLTESIYYRVDAVEGPTVFSESLVSNSNYVVYTRKGEIWLPTAFTPQSDINNVFKPYSTFIKSEGYTFQIYNRMGLKVFETTDLTQGWDGTFKGNYVQQGAYVYVIYCTFSDGTSHVQKGTVVVVN
jgi:gliding motility-associated-like protein